MQDAVEGTDVRITEFTVAPQITPDNEELPYHEWFIEFEKAPEDPKAFATALDESLQKQNSYYFDLIKGKVLQPLKITPVVRDAFQEYMKSIGKLGGQNKLPRLSNDRKIADRLEKL